MMDFLGYQIRNQHKQQHTKSGFEIILAACSYSFNTFVFCHFSTLHLPYLYVFQCFRGLFCMQISLNIISYPAAGVTGASLPRTPFHPSLGLARCIWLPLWRQLDVSDPLSLGLARCIWPPLWSQLDVSDPSLGLARCIWPKPYKEKQGKKKKSKGDRRGKEEGQKRTKKNAPNKLSLCQDPIGKACKWPSISQLTWANARSRQGRE